LTKSCKNYRKLWEKRPYRSAPALLDTKTSKTHQVKQCDTGEVDRMKTIERKSRNRPKFRGDFFDGKCRISWDNSLVLEKRKPY
jgi:hypothetical protein